MADQILTAKGPDGILFACVSHGSRFCKAAVADTRFAAVLRPFADVDAARTALTAAGGTLSEGSAT